MNTRSSEPWTTATVEPNVADADGGRGRMRSAPASSGGSTREAVHEGDGAALRAGSGAAALSAAERVVELRSGRVRVSAAPALRAHRPRRRGGLRAPSFLMRDSSVVGLRPRIFAAPRGPLTRPP